MRRVLRCRNGRGRSERYAPASSLFQRMLRRGVLLIHLARRRNGWPPTAALPTSAGVLPLRSADGAAPWPDVRRARLQTAKPSAMSKTDGFASLPQRKLNVGTCRTDALRGHGPTTGAAAPSSDVQRFPLSVAWRQQLHRTLYVNFRMYLGALMKKDRHCIDRNARLCGGYGGTVRTTTSARL